jgi:AcrR family transcriptional regulator
MIMEAALRIMGTDGLLSARTLDIAKAAHVAHGTVFVHFPTRDDLLCAVIDEFGRRVSYRLHILAARGRGFRENLKAHLKGLSEYEPLYARLISECRLIPRRARMSFVMIQSAISLHLGAAVEKETREGILRPMPLHLLFNTWIGLVHHYLINGDLFAPNKPSVLKKYGTVLIDHFCALVARESHGEQGGGITDGS